MYTMYAICMLHIYICACIICGSSAVLFFWTMCMSMYMCTTERAQTFSRISGPIMTSCMHAHSMYACNTPRTLIAAPTTWPASYADCARACRVASFLAEPDNFIYTLRVIYNYLFRRPYVNCLAT
jgi:hypothetical protein